MVDGHFVGHGLQVLAQEAVVVERPDEIVHHFTLVCVEVVLPHLPHEVIIGRCAARKRHFVAPSRLVGPFLQIGRHIVFAHVVAQRVAYFSPLPFRFGFGPAVIAVFLSAFVFVVAVAFGGRLLQRGVVHHFVLHAFGQVGQRQFHQAGQCHL